MIYQKTNNAKQKFYNQIDSLVKTPKRCFLLLNEKSEIYKKYVKKLELFDAQIEI